MPNSRCSIGIYEPLTKINAFIIYLWPFIYLHYFYGRVTRDGALGV